MRKRLNIIVIFVVIITTFLIGRILYIQTVNKNVLTSGAVSQRILDIKVASGRANIFDKNMIPLTKKDNTKAVIFKRQLSDPEKTAEEISKYLPKAITKEDITKNKNCEITIPVRREQIENSDALNNVILLDNTDRYDSTSLLTHLIGYVDNDDNGVTGLEVRYNDILRSDLQTNAQILVDAGRSMYIEKQPNYVSKGSSYIGGIQLTIDYSIQKKVEDILKTGNYKGAVIVTDPKTGDVLACASAPTYLPNNVAAYMNSSNSELSNRLEGNYEPGSVFKLVMIAAALESGEEFSNMKFNCNGAMDINGVSIPCWSKAGHGEEDLSHALSNSCNPAFIQLGLALGQDRIMDMAYKMGLGGTRTIYDGEQVTEGFLPSGKMVSAQIANMSIGQGNTLVTPLQMAGMLDIIASGGIKRPLNSVSGIVNNEGKIVVPLKRVGYERVISESTAKKIMEMMQLTVEEGTASKGKIEGVETACKTGTAQSGWADEDGNLMTHAWFVGIVNPRDPTYNITIFIENGKMGNTVSGEIFSQIVQSIRLNG